MTGNRIALLASLLVVGGAASSALAGFTPAWSYVPAPLRAHLASQTGGSLFLPARTPLFYRYRSGAKVVAGTLSVPFTNRVRVRAGVWRWTDKTFLWQVRPLTGTSGCTSWKPIDKKLQLDGNKVFWSAAAGTAWRCVTARNGKELILSASASGAPGDVGLGIVVASGLDVGNRSGTPTVALTVAPPRISAGGTVLVRGVAGGCTSGDTVTLISHAFAATHSFAGVPAVFARVGSAGRFSAATRIPRSRKPGVYTVTARCGGGNLGLTAHLSVVT